MDPSEECDKQSDHDEETQSNLHHECLVCFRVFANSYRLRRHSIVHSTENKIFNCQFCDLTFRLHNELIMHESTHQRTLANINLKRCKICGIACYEDNLLAHFKEFHEHFECDLCKKVFRTKSHLKLHMRIHINARDFKCSICPKTFNFFTQLKRHEGTHSPSNVWYCEICGVGFKSKPSLSHHMRALHNGEKPFQCDRCDRCFSAKQSLDLHIRIHDGTKPYKCPWVECGRGFHDLTTMKVHTRQHTNENPYKCHLCGKTTKQASNMKSHYLHAHKIKDITSKTIRANARLFEKYKTEDLPESGLLEILSQQVMQNLANQYAANNNAIKEELTTEKLNSGRQEYVGNLMKEPTTSSVERNEQTNVVSDNAIKLESSCDIEFVSSDVRNNTFHVKEEACDAIASAADAAKIQKESQVTPKNRHNPKKPAVETVIIGDLQSTEIEDVVVKSEDRFYVFQISELEDGAACSDPIKSECTDNTAPTNGQTPNDSPVQKSNKTFHCDICPKSYSQKSKLKFHIKSMHTVEGIGIDKRKMCEICGKTYGENSALQKHLKFTHSNIRPFSCEICGRSFKDSNGLKVHKRSHSGEKPYSCSFCSKSFSTSIGRNLHQRSHTGEKPYKCTFCDSAFSDSSTCKQHIRVHTGEKPYVCHLCGKGTTQAGNLKSHLRHAHKIHVKHVTMKQGN
ncbi:oocyte zinc finger protein XlCOF6-like [Bradysia coprophila]|uniref:oocyte zinc finger protein XlCOF6-like n=1 Tax=Bradysia coprophila TaxID=38358 RepID=UPI00187DC709|nr:oocyte zinc finger protein XlCOF6-like [Bradysia coprophila]